jgi:hypothetical protein
LAEYGSDENSGIWCTVIVRLDIIRYNEYYGMNGRSGPYGGKEQARMSGRNDVSGTVQNN